MVDIPLIDLKAQYATLRPAVDEAVAEVLATTGFIGGPQVKEFEENFAEFGNYPEVVACGNGTDALELLLDAWEIGEGDEVIVPAMSWISTSEVVATRGAKPIFVDVDPKTYCIDPALIPAAITSRTKCIIAVHLYGHPADLGAIRKIADEHSLYLIEDCAQAHGAFFGEHNIGTVGDGATFSFFPSKSLGAYGDAGAVIAPSPELGTRVRALANHGMPGRRHHHVYHGRNSRMDALQAAVLNVKIPHLAGWITAKNQHAKRYQDNLEDLDPGYLSLPSTAPDCYHGFHLFVIRTERRDELAEFLTAKGVANTVHYPTALPLHACYAEDGYRAEDYPVSVNLGNTALSLPMFAELTDEQIDYVSDQLKEFFAA
ncbi:DegT/DnrJ/EryC1/StrS family aminotransferase [Neolewinella antarctica]|uniref:dTDP-4-amino-4,6-dideoxygalactose transaminase n=1 Tax=Neolewinella antarctica TaxID=442734 RepID=A0ABX0XA89_9BACT|nr:DegT/DnrJ/EryC1/StrS family aminotransferase [Neolewinella antarctica]NJC26142.1 dTDP-4-amino-4,6-dideoxygalactose transaminase [Neolewinella antarctica]